LEIDAIACGVAVLVTSADVDELSTKKRTSTFVQNNEKHLSRGALFVFDGWKLVSGQTMETLVIFLAMINFLMP